MTRFGEKVKSTRESLKLGQEQLANLIGVSRRTIECSTKSAIMP